MVFVFFSFSDLVLSSERFIFLSYLRITRLTLTTSFWGPHREEKQRKKEENRWRNQKDDWLDVQAKYQGLTLSTNKKIDQNETITGHHNNGATRRKALSVLTSSLSNSLSFNIHPLTSMKITIFHQKQLNHRKVNTFLFIFDNFQVNNWDSAREMGYIENSFGFMTRVVSNRRTPL